MSQARAAKAPSVFREPTFIRLWLARACSILSTQMLGVAIGWQVYALTNSTYALGLVGLVQFLPQVLLLLAVGHAADRFERKKIMAACQCANAVTAVLLALFTVLGRAHVAGIFAALAAFGIARAFEGPCYQALVPVMVEESMAAKAIAWATSAGQSAAIVGPALGGLLYVFGAHVPYALGALLFACASTLSLSLRPRRPAASRAVDNGSIFSGFHYMRTHPNIFGAISLDLFVVLLGGAVALLPAFARDVLHTGPWGLGLLRLAPAAGALLSSVLFAHRAIERNVGLRMFAAVMVFGAATIGFALSHWLWLSLVMLMVLGGADVVSVVIRGSLVQLETPDEMRGRVGAVNSLFIGTSNELGAFESGVTAAWFGLIPATVLGGVGSIIVALIWMRLFPGLRRLDRFHTV